MDRIFGAAALLISTLILGRVSASELRRRPEQLRRLIDALEQLRAELAAFATLNDALLRASDNLDEDVQAYILAITDRMEAENIRFHLLWETEIYRLRFLLPAERQILQPLGSILGRYDLASQLRALDRCISELVKREAEAKEKARTEAVLRLRLTTAIGALLLIVLW